YAAQIEPRGAKKTIPGQRYNIVSLGVRRVSDESGFSGLPPSMARDLGSWTKRTATSQWPQPRLVGAGLKPARNRPLSCYSLDLLFAPYRYRKTSNLTNAHLSAIICLIRFWMLDLGFWIAQNSSRFFRFWRLLPSIKPPIQ